MAVSSVVGLFAVNRLVQWIRGDGPELLSNSACLVVFALVVIVWINLPESGKCSQPVSDLAKNRSLPNLCPTIYQNYSEAPTGTCTTFSDSIDTKIGSSPWNLGLDIPSIVAAPAGVFTSQGFIGSVSTLAEGTMPTSWSSVRAYRGPRDISLATVAILQGLSDACARLGTMTYFEIPSSNTSIGAPPPYVWKPVELVASDAPLSEAVAAVQVGTKWWNVAASLSVGQAVTDGGVDANILQGAAVNLLLHPPVNCMGQAPPRWTMIPQTDPAAALSVYGPPIALVDAGSGRFPLRILTVTEDDLIIGNRFNSNVISTYSSASITEMFSVVVEPTPVAYDCRYFLGSYLTSNKGITASTCSTKPFPSTTAHYVFLFLVGIIVLRQWAESQPDIGPDVPRPASEPPVQTIPPASTTRRASSVSRRR